ncbi:MAG: ferredoxin--NADP reductase, partial [Polyangiaceae bacterium]
MPAPPSFEARIVSRRMVSPAVFELTLERCDGAPITFDAGQWVSLTLPIEGAEIKRSYSVASAPSRAPRFELAITLVSSGPGSNYLYNANIGTVLRVIGPQGFFTRTAHPAAPSLFVATGTGLTPFRSMILEAQLTAETWLLFGARTQEDLIYRDELEKAAENNSLF